MDLAVTPTGRNSSSGSGEAASSNRTTLDSGGVAGVLGQRHSPRSDRQSPRSGINRSYRACTQTEHTSCTIGAEIDYCCANRSYDYRVVEDTGAQDARADETSKNASTTTTTTVLPAFNRRAAPSCIGRITTLVSPIVPCPVSALDVPMYPADCGCYRHVPISLSSDIWQIICSFLSPSDLLEVGLGCTSLRSIADNPNRWKHFCRHWAPSSSALNLWGLVWALEGEQRALQAARNGDNVPPWGAVYSPEASLRLPNPKASQSRLILEPCQCLNPPVNCTATDTLPSDRSLRYSDNRCLLLDDPLTLFGITAASRDARRRLVHWKRFWTAHLGAHAIGPESKRRVLQLSSNRIIWRVDMQDLLTSRRVVLNHSFEVERLDSCGETLTKLKSLSKSTSIDVIFKIEFVNYSDRTWRLEFWAKKLSASGEPYGGFQTRLLAKRRNCSKASQNQPLYIPSTRGVRPRKPINYPTRLKCYTARQQSCDFTDDFRLDESDHDSGHYLANRFYQPQPRFGRAKLHCPPAIPTPQSSATPVPQGSHDYHSSSDEFQSDASTVFSRANDHDSSGPQSTPLEACGGHDITREKNLHETIRSSEAVASRPIDTLSHQKQAGDELALRQGINAGTSSLEVVRGSSETYFSSNCARGSPEEAAASSKSASPPHISPLEIRRSVWVSEGVEWGWTNFVSSGEAGSTSCADPWQCEAMYFDIKWLWLQQAVLDCLSHKICTYRVTGPSHTVQPWYHCFTCRLDGTAEDSYGCCEACAKSCHQGHKVEFQKVTVCFCDCGHNACHRWARERLEPNRQLFSKKFSCSP